MSQVEIASTVSPGPESGSHGNEHRDLAKGAFINTLGIFAKASKAIYMIMFSRLFGRDLFGLFLLTFAIVDVASKVAAIGLDWGTLRLMVRLRAEDRHDEIRWVMKRILFIGFISSTLTAIVLAFFSHVVAIRIMGKDELSRPLLLICCALPFMTMTSILLFAIRAARRMQFEVYVRSLGEPMVLLAAGFIAFLFHREIAGIVFAQIASALGGSALAYYFFTKVYPRPAVPVRGKLKWSELISYSAPMGGMDLLNIFKQRLDLIVIGRFLPIGFVGVFGAVTEVSNVIKKIRQAFEPIFMPIVSYLHEKREKARLHQNFVLAVRWIMIPSLPLLALMVVIPEEWLRVFGKGFTTGSSALVVMALGQFFYVTFGLSESVLSMTGHAYVNLLNSAALVGINFGLLLWLVPKFGLVGAAIATGISYGIVSILRLVQAYRYVRVHPFGASQLKPLGAAALAAGIAWLAKWTLKGHQPWIVTVVPSVFFLTYLLMLRGMGFEKEDREVMGRLKIRMGRIFSRKRPKSPIG